MKKIVLGLTGLMLTTSVTAESFFDYKEEINLGYSLKTYEYKKTQRTQNLDGYFLGFKALKTLRTFENGQSLAVGFGVDFTYVPNLGLDPIVKNDIEYLMDILPRLTYALTDSLDVSALVGYTIGQRTQEVFGSNYTYDIGGISYGLGSSYEIVTDLRVNLDVVAINADYELDGVTYKADIVNYMFGLGYSF